MFVLTWYCNLENSATCLFSTNHGQPSAPGDLQRIHSFNPTFLQESRKPSQILFSQNFFPSCSLSLFFWCSHNILAVTLLCMVCYVLSRWYVSDSSGTLGAPREKPLWLFIFAPYNSCHNE